MRTFLFTLLAVLFATTGAQDSWPSRPLTVVVPYQSGVAPDLAARALGSRLSIALGQPVVVSNRPGFGGLIGAEEAARAKPDGYTLYVGDDVMFGIVPHVYRNLRFSPGSDFVPIAGLVENQFLLAVRSDLPVTNLRSFIEFARRASPPLAYGSAGIGSQHHLTMERLRDLAGIEMLHVPFRGGAHTAGAVVTGDVAAAFVGAGAVGHIKAGRLRVIATTGPERSKGFPEVQTLNEVFPGLEMTNWQGLFAPAGTPRAVLERLEAEARRAVATDDFVQRVGGTGDMKAYPVGAEALAQRIRRDNERYRPLIERLGIKVD